MARVFLLLILLVGACMKAPDPAGMSPGTSAPQAVRPTVSLTAPPDWQAMEPDLEFYLHKWQLPEGAIATISWLGPGSDKEFIIQNVQRWLNEWTSAAGEPIADYAFDKTMNGAYTMHRLELTGTLTGVRQLGGGDPRPDWSLDGVVVETARGALFFKLIGPKETVARQRDAVWQMLGGLSLH